ncbi:hypothetical protein AAC387_Pa02g4921 [Persea americana]
MGVYRYILENPHAIVDFRAQYRIPDNIEVRLDNPEDILDGLVFNNGWMMFWLVTVIEGFRQRRVRAKKTSRVRNNAWLQQVKNYHGHHTRAAWSLLGYEPRYCSFNKRKVTGIDSLLFEDGTSVEQVTVAIPAGRRSSRVTGLQYLARTQSLPKPPQPQPKPLCDRGDQSRYRQARKKKREKCCADIVVEDLEALAVGDQALDAPQHTGDASASPPAVVAAETTFAPFLRLP